MRQGTEFNVAAAVLCHLDGGQTRVKLLGVGRPDKDPDYPHWDIPTNSIPVQLRSVGSKIAIHYVTPRPEPNDSPDAIRAARDHYEVTHLADAAAEEIASKPPTYWARIVK